MASRAEAASTEEEVVNKYRFLQNEVQMLSSKSTELDLERQEHDLVLEALGNCDDTRRYVCGRRKKERWGRRRQGIYVYIYASGCVCVWMIVGK